jgi:hypothetical protein
MPVHTLTTLGYRKNAPITGENPAAHADSIERVTSFFAQYLGQAQ